MIDRAEMAQLVTAFVNGADETARFLAMLEPVDKDDIVGKAVVRYVMSLGKWEYGQESFKRALDKFFGYDVTRTATQPAAYVAATSHIIKEMFDHEMPVRVAPPMVAKTAPKRRKKSSTEKHVVEC